MGKYNNELDFRRFIREAKHLWWGYAATFVLFMAVAVFYYMRSMPQYRIEATMLIEDPSENTPSGGNGMSAIMRSFSIGGFGSSSADNELAIIGSNDVRRKVVSRLELNRNYIERDGLRKKILFNNTPVIVEASDRMFDSLKRGMMVRIKLKDGKVDAKVTQGRFFSKTTLAEIKNASLPCTLTTPYGKLLLLKSNKYTPGMNMDIDVIISSNEVAANDLYDNLDVTIVDLKTDVISLGYDDPCRERGVDILNTVMEEYNRKRIDRRHFNAAQEVSYFNARIQHLFSDLTDSEDKLEKFKKENNLLGIEQEAEVLVENTVGKKEDIARLQAMVDYYNDVLDVLRNKKDENILIPVMEKTENPAVNEYNAAIMKRKNLERSATSENPALMLLNSQIDYLRESISKNVEGALDQARVNLAAMQQLAGTAASRIKSMPGYEREYLTLLRDQTFKNELYMFLLQKRESSELKLYSNTSLGFVIDPAYSDIKPKNTKAVLVVILALIMSFVCPTCLVAVVLFFRKKIIEPMDLKSLGLEDNSILYDGNNRRISDLRHLLINDGRKLFYVLNYSGRQDFKEKISDNFKNIGKTLIWDDSLKDNDELLTKKYVDNISEMKEKYDCIFINVPYPDSLHAVSEIMASGDAGILVVIESDHTTRSTLEKDLKDFPREIIDVLILARS